MGHWGMTKKMTLEQRFYQRVTPLGPDDCWLWRGRVTTGYWGGYPTMPTGTRQCNIMAHKFIYELTFGPIPEGLEMDHICHSQSDCRLSGPDCLHRRCVNPYHLEAVTHAENLRRRHTKVA